MCGKVSSRLDAGAFRRRNHAARERSGVQPAPLRDGSERGEENMEREQGNMRKNVFTAAGGSVLALAVAFVLLLDAACGFRASKCTQCGRMECRNMAFSIRLKNGESVETCCPRCGLHYLEAEHPDTASLSVRDFDTADAIEAKRSFYVDGSDVTPCHMTASGPPRDEQGCCMVTAYDRCEPSLLAFGSKRRAETFAREHGGVLKTFEELQASRPVSAPGPS